MARLVGPLRKIFGRGICSTSSLTAPTLSVFRRTNREPPSRYEPGGYHPVSAGQVYNNHYQVVKDIGWGLYSTVWLVQDTHDQSLAAMKVLVADLTTDTGGVDELGCLQILAATNIHSPGYRHISHLLDHFTQQGPNGTHICLVLEPLGLSCLDVYRALPIMPFSLIKRICKHVLLSLQYMHDECSLVHTDIKGDNILMSCTSEVEISMEELNATIFKLSDFGSTNPLSNKFAPLIQPTALRAPEVIIGAEWGTKADIWNFGCLMYEFARGAQLFDPSWQNEETGMNPPQTHLAQIMGLLGDFPPSMLAKGSKTGRYFDEQGRLIQGASRYNISLDDLLRRSKQPPGEIPVLVDFLSKALVIDPEERWSAAQLLAHPWVS